MPPVPMNRILPGVLGMALTVLASNILVQFPLGAFLTWGALTYPVAFLITDLTNRIHGAAAARRVVLAGFGTGLLCSLVGTQIIGEFGPLVTLRIALGSGIAYFVGQMSDVAIFSLLRGRRWWQAPLVSTLVSATLDTAIFFSIAFSATLAFIEPGNDVSWAGDMMPLLGVGVLLPFWASLAVGDWCVKITLAILSLVPFRLIVRRFA